MIYQYVVTLKNQQSRYLDIIGILLSLVSVLFFSMEMIKSSGIGWALLAGSIFIVGLVAWNIWHSIKTKRKVHYSRALLIAGLVWRAMPYYQWLCFVFILLALLEYQAKYAIEIGFGEKDIVINSFPKKRYLWNQLNNVLLKDGMITMDFANNKLLQREILDDEDDDADEDEFNEFCTRQLRLAKKV